MNNWDASVIAGIFGLIVYILFFAGLVIKIKQGEKKAKSLKELEKTLESKYSEKKNKN